MTSNSPPQGCITDPVTDPSVSAMTEPFYSEVSASVRDPFSDTSDSTASNLTEPLYSEFSSEPSFGFSPLITEPTKSPREISEPSSLSLEKNEK
mmetsp:Transcript_26854/g.41856  ORF Transcript_26854/g.41856 Transcript_26854/m.41856 type:complete len:94 (-) Transcript_26854:101-382(-)|eukprot:CAMPEP_0201539570 /NCGR_PEP_ID=MMETSP0161_2-20130828/70479_1 /ASSEMBLY_ACC=CAM_ASM_000251 /TAXON_ID=180227 /ORGANISM="Neoparamoeba aestuarina, Strain SoJaBio B1-5/56/2" /LENGTH=93 /DNA_ID=CAMNT_0047946977 /DNA_START=117 /DNA_END=398 /DNA_ORIENTATION=+